MDSNTQYSDKRINFLKDVKHEIDALKANATKDELAQLDIDTFNYRTQSSCIYGQLTGNCESNRAKELMNVSCKRVMHLVPKEDVWTGAGVDTITNSDIDDETFTINGEYKEELTWANGRTGRYKYLSALEGYICTRGAKNKEIISYMKGEIDTLEL